MAQIKHKLKPVMEDATLQATLLEAIMQNDSPTVISVLEAGANPNFTEDSSLIRPLHFAALYNAIDCINPLVNAGADVRLRTHDEQLTPLGVAKQHQHHKAFKALLKFSHLPSHDQVVALEVTLLH